MLSLLITVLFLISPWALALFGGSGDALLSGAEEAVTLCLRMCGAICFWSALMELMEASGLCAKLGKCLKPLLIRLFPLSAGREDILSALTENISANLLGLGNAATPAGIRAAKGIAALGSSASDELCMLVVINTASLQLLPGTIAALRASLGAGNAFDIIPAVWVSAGLAMAAGLACAAVLRRVWPA